MGALLAVDPVRRICKVERGMSACLITGTEKVRSGYGNGDCLLLNFKHGIFAVADGTERYPWASRRLLERLQSSIGAGNVPGDLTEWRERVVRVCADQEYHQKTTLSGVILLGGDTGMTMYVIHGGDSSVVLLGSGDGSVVYSTSPDMNFAGRSSQVTVTEHPLADSRSRVMIATDGLNDVLQHNGYAPGERVSDILYRNPVHEIGERIYQRIFGNRSGIEYDDIGLIVLDPFHLDASGSCVLMGGTTPREETRFRDGIAVPSPGEWLIEGEWQKQSDRLRSAGIEARTGTVL